MLWIVTKIILYRRLITSARFGLPAVSAKAPGIIPSRAFTDKYGRIKCSCGKLSRIDKVYHELHTVVEVMTILAASSNGLSNTSSSPKQLHEFSQAL